jgi:hypothetical protein
VRIGVDWHVLCRSFCHWGGGRYGTVCAVISYDLGPIFCIVGRGGMLRVFIAFLFS